jgi:2'-5' RNA ligase
VPSLDDIAPVAAPTQTAIIVPVAAAEPVVDVYRQRLDRAASWGVPAHVTVLYPFLHPAAVDEGALAALTAAVSSVPAFECSFATTGWFDSDVVWLHPEPSDPFRQLTSAVWTAFPDHPPYGGAFDGSVPHLTIGEQTVADQHGASVTALQEAEIAVRAALPLRQKIDYALLIAGSPTPWSWRTLHRLPLA